MTRPVPQLASGWTAGDRGKVYATRRAAYYAIAKKLVVAKYPVALNEAHSAGLPSDFPEDKIEKRATKARELFWINDQHFDSDKWKAFISRVAKFLMFVDDRRGPLHALPPVDSLQKAHELAERNAVLWMELAAKLRAAMETRS